MDKLTEIERLVSIGIIQEDAESIYSLLQTEEDPIFCMEIIPYYALFIQSCQEYMGKVYVLEPVAQDLKDIRNHIKAYSDRFGKSKKRVLSVDDQQNQDFKSQLRFKFLKNKNIHLNLGTYWMNARHIIGNTQQLADFLSVENIFDNKNREKYSQISYQIGTFTESIRECIASSLKYPLVERPCISTKINSYYDINTNKKNRLFLEKQPKEINLFFLHLLCNMNFVKYVLRPLFIDGNIWAFRVEYIVTYYTLRRLERLKNYCENNDDISIETEEINKILSQGEKLFKTKLRNCMMHYNLENAGVIAFENIEKPFYGIIENCFDNMNYYEYLHCMHSLSDKIIAYLENQFDFSDIKLKSF